MCNCLFLLPCLFFFWFCAVVASRARARSFDLSKQSSGDMPAAAMRALSSFAVIVSIVFLVASDEEEEGAEPYRSETPELTISISCITSGVFLCLPTETHRSSNC